MNIVEINNLTKEFNGRFSKKRLLAVDNVTLNIKRGEILGLLGINGAGKTTLLKMICGLLKPTSGEVLILGKSLEKNRSHLLNHIGAVLEGSRNSLWSMTVKQNLTYFGHLNNTHGLVL
jgi:ABC-2 type transport system ATP-binding protein